MEETLEFAMKKISELERKLENYYQLLFIENELDFILRGSYLVEDELNKVISGNYEINI